LNALVGNQADGDGGGISNTGGGTLDLLNVTIADNTADFDNDGVGDGGGVFDSTGAFQARNAILAGNVDNGGHPSGAVCEAADHRRW
jgi:hypothetical protein